MEFFFEWLMIAVIALLAAASPGPDMVMAVRNSVLYSRTAGLWTAVGFGCGVCVHVVYCMAGIAALVASSVALFTVLKYTGAAYLIYIGLKSLRARPRAAAPDGLSGGTAESRVLGAGAAWRCGFFTNLLNPKATMFFFALFTQVIEPGTPVTVQAVYGGTAALMVTGWFSFVALVLTRARLRRIFLRGAHWIDRICGGLLVGLGVRLALSKNV